MWELDHKEDWVPKNWCFQTVVLEKTLESPLDCKEIKPVHPKGNQPWLFTGRTDAAAETPILWSPDVKSQFIEKDPDAGKEWREEQKKAIANKIVGWHHRLKGHEFEQALGDGEEQWSLLCCSYGVAKSQTRLRNWTTELGRFPSWLMGKQDSCRAGCWSSRPWSQGERDGSVAGIPTQV